MMFFFPQDGVGMSELENDLASYQHLDENSPGTIIFSPQDLRPAPLKYSRGPQTPGQVLTNKIEYQEPPLTPAQKKAEAIADDLEKLKDKDSPVACSFCGKVMMSGKTLVQHMSIHADYKPFQCSHCPKSFTRKVQLQGHLVSHGIEKQFECPVCHQRFSRRDCVKIHMRIHDKSKCALCEVCHKSFLTVGALNIHMRIHRGEKPFKCHLCGKCFTQKNHLITHIKRHTKVEDVHFAKKLGPRMFKCEHCPRSFIRLSDYERHVQWNHGAVADVNNMTPHIQEETPEENLPKVRRTPSSTAPARAPRDVIIEKSKPFRKIKKEPIVMCTSSTQTDEGGGHIIIPRQYKSELSENDSSQEAILNTPAPHETPNRVDEDAFDAYDEGMDRNFSSDEEEDGQITEENQPQQRVFNISSNQSNIPTSTESAQDAAFDAMINSTSESIKRVGVGQGEEHILPHALDSDQPHERVFIIQNENDSNEPTVTTGDSTFAPPTSVSQVIASDTTVISEKPAQEKLITASNDDLNKHVGSDNFRQMVQSSYQSMVTKTKPAPKQISMPPPPKQVKKPIVLGTEDLKNLNPKRGRPKSKGSSMKGATQLHLIRKNMKNFISDSHEEAVVPEPAEPQSEMEAILIVPPEGGEDNNSRGPPKRQAKKQHGKDFQCTSKSCEVCKPGADGGDKNNKILLKRHLAPGTVFMANSGKVMKSEKAQKKELNLSQLAEGGSKKYVEMVNLLSFGVKEVSSPLPDFKSKDLEKQDYIEVKEKNRYHVGKEKTSDDSIVSPPVDVQSFCIPTYSCKLCGREFRFEGKLHRHIEAVHQNKNIYTADVKPGRGQRMHFTDYENLGLDEIIGQAPEENMIFTDITEENDITEEEQEAPEALVNPEIEALRSEWDDDEDEEEDEGVRPTVTKPQAIYNLNPPPSKTQAHQLFHQRQMQMQAQVKQQQAAQKRALSAVVTRNIQPVSNPGSSLYSSGVVVNMNKLSGILPCHNTKYEQSNVISQEREQNADSAVDDKSLDARCQKLLLKLFNHDLLMDCGLNSEHVSVVLGKVLQHYGVKMIEDYGQGQYEVLKYNLWRLMEWKVTIEQMEEFYRENKSVEEMMDDIMNERVPLVSHEVITEAQAKERAAQAEEMVGDSDHQMVVEQEVEGEHVVVHGTEQVLIDQSTGQHIVVHGVDQNQFLVQGTADGGSEGPSQQIVLQRTEGGDSSNNTAMIMQQVMGGYLLLS